MLKYAELMKRKEYVAQLAKDCGYIKLSRSLADCGTFAQTIANKTLDKHYAYNILRCHSSFCPLCSAIKARSNAEKLETILYYELTRKWKSGTPKYKLLFITLTCPNAPLTIKGVYRTYRYLLNVSRRFINDPRIKGWGKGNNGIAKGIIRKFEYTYHSGINIHFHLPVLVRSSYFEKGHMKSKEWFDKVYKDSCKGKPYNIMIASAYYKNGKFGKKHYLNKKTPKRMIRKVARKVAKEVGKYVGKDNPETQAMKKKKKNKKHKVPKAERKAVRAFKAVYTNFKGITPIYYFGLFRSGNHMYKKHALDKYKEKMSKDNTLYVYSDDRAWKNKQSKSLGIKLISFNVLTKLIRQSIKEHINRRVLIGGKIFNTNNIMLKAIVKKHDRELKLRVKVNHFRDLYKRLFNIGRRKAIKQSSYLIKVADAYIDSSNYDYMNDKLDKSKSQIEKAGKILLKVQNLENSYAFFIGDYVEPYYMNASHRKLYIEKEFN